MKAPNYIRIGNDVVHRDQIRRQLAAQVQQLVGHMEFAKESTQRGAPHLIESYEAMIQDRCNLLARLSNRNVVC